MTCFETCHLEKKNLPGDATRAHLPDPPPLLLPRRRRHAPSGKARVVPAAAARSTAVRCCDGSDGGTPTLLVDGRGGNTAAAVGCSWLGQRRRDHGVAASGLDLGPGPRAGQQLTGCLGLPGMHAGMTCVRHGGAVAVVLVTICTRGSPRFSPVVWAGPVYVR